MQKASNFLIHILQVQRIIYLQNIANNLPDVFSDYKGVTSLSILQGMCPKEWRYLIKPLISNLAKRGGEALPRSRMLLQTSKRRLEMQLNLWLKDT
jgi:hypothetical protein